MAWRMIDFPAKFEWDKNSAISQTLPNVSTFNVITSAQWRRWELSHWCAVIITPIDQIDNAENDGNDDDCWYDDRNDPSNQRTSTATSARDQFTEAAAAHFPVFEIYKLNCSNDATRFEVEGFSHVA